MPTIMPVSQETAEGQVKEIFEEIKSVLNVSQVPTLYRIMAHNPEYLETSWRRIRIGLYTNGRLDVRAKRMISLAVSATNNDPYMVSDNTSQLKAMGMSDAEIAELMTIVDVTNGLNKFIKGFQIDPGT